MKAIFTYILRADMNAVPIILIVLVTRLFLGNVSRKGCYFLWIAVGFRLLINHSIPSSISVYSLPVYDQYRDISRIVLPAYVNVDSGAFHSGTTEKAFVSTSNIFADLLPWIWFSVGLLMVTRAVIQDIGLQKKLSGAVRRDHNVYYSEAVRSPFVHGVFCPKIYLPYNLDEMAERYILLHEEYHIRRKDPLWKLTAYLLVCLHWYNPLVYLCMRLFASDMEMSCDEYVISQSNVDRKIYGLLLVSFAAGQGAPPRLSFVHNSAKERVVHLLKYRKLRLVFRCMGLLFLTAGLAACLSDPLIVTSVSSLVSSHPASGFSIRPEDRDLDQKYAVNPQDHEGIIPRGDEDMIQYMAGYNCSFRWEEIVKEYDGYEYDQGRSQIQIIITADGGFYAGFPDSDVSVFTGRYVQEDEIYAFYGNEGARVHTHVQPPEQLDETVKGYFALSDDRAVLTMLNEKKQEFYPAPGQNECRAYQTWKDNQIVRSVYIAEP